MKSINNVPQKSFYIVEVKDSRDLSSTFVFEESGLADQMVRALVHEGYKVSISESFKPVTLEEEIELCGPRGFRGRLEPCEDASDRPQMKYSTPTAIPLCEEVGPRGGGGRNIRC